MKKILTTMAFALFSVFVLAQTTPEERFTALKENYEKVMAKLDNGTLTLEDENYMECRKMFKKINSYDKYTTMATDEFKTIQTTFDGIKDQLQLGAVYLSKTKDGSPATEFTAGEPMFLILKCGMTTVEQSMNEDPNDYSKKVMRIYFESDQAKGSGIAYHQVPMEKYGDNEYVLDLTLNGSNPEFADVYNYLGGLGKGKHTLEVILPRGTFVSSISKAVPRVELPITLTIKDDKLTKISDAASADAYQSVTLEKAVVNDPDLEFMLISLFLDYQPEYNVKKLNIIEDWYELKDGGRLTYMKLNCHIAVTDDSGTCYRVYVGFVKENTADVGVKLGPIEVLDTGAKLKYIKMPCENIK